MGVVVGEVVRVNGYAVGTLDESKYEVPSVFNVECRKNAVYVIS